jgi:hypothetical protein
MTTPIEFLERVDDAIDEAARTLTHIAPVGRPAWLGRFQFRVATKWREVFAGMLKPEDVDSLVENIVATVQTRLAEIESVGPVTLH